MRRTVVRVLFVTLTCVSFSPTSYAQFGPYIVQQQQQDIESTATELRGKIDKALDAIVDLEFSDTTLEQLAEKISTEFKFPVVLDVRGLQSSGFSPADKFSKSFSGVTLRTALDLIYQEMGLTYWIDADAYVITSREAGARRLTTRVYEITRFVTGTNDKALVVKLQSRQEIAPKVDELFDLIYKTVEPETWDELGGSGALAYLGVRNQRHFISVFQTETGHYKLRKTLDELEGMLDQPPIANDDDNEVSVRVYPLNHSAVNAEQAKELLELAMEGIDWQEPHYIKVVGDTLAIKQTAKVHAHIAAVLTALAETPDN